MNFWERVDDLLDRNDINKKTLAIEAKFDPSNITKGIKNNNIPSADTAVRIAKVLGVTVEYLVNGTDSAASKKDSNRLQKEMELFRKYRTHVDKLEKLTPTERTALIHLAEELGEK